ncbi:potassium/sodium hyperpolarization-activated cyclic nucleotide-gated channel 4-like [Lutra lutra]|uniref:potassium/sodium hyperpolarization-activated cyclic nucleotide-gated channel 4-like n=1 Tax=Lutra lutra TaxID=9657 RepID=UPI001FD330E4|nr:potassium/sodium hyperpolarization-activated cyclic nucleotide-gated channel 4-like [Lutra lutra]
METVPQGSPAPRRTRARAAGVSLPPPPRLGPAAGLLPLLPGRRFLRDAAGPRLPGRALGTRRRGREVREGSGDSRGGASTVAPASATLRLVRVRAGSAGRGLTNGPSADGRPRAALRGARVALPARGPRRAHGPPLPGKGGARGVTAGGGHVRSRRLPHRRVHRALGPGRPKPALALGAPS